MRPTATVRAPTLVTVLSGLRDSSGRPNTRVKVLAVVVALLLAGPLTVFLLRGLATVFDLLV
jgi:hypothetical protein